MLTHAIALACAGHSVVGRRRNNQDALLLRAQLGLFAVADGIGGYAGGEIASATVITALEDFVSRIHVDAEGTWPVRARRALGPLEAVVDAALRIADREVQARRTGVLARMGSTAVVALFRDRRLVVGNVGDSRLYRLRDGALAQLTADHSVAAELERSGMAPADVAPGFLACLTRAIGMPGSAEPDVVALPVQRGDTYLLCSDGLWGVLDDATIAAHLGHADVRQACATLIAAADAAGSTDNITAVVIRAEPAAHGSGRMP
jgi:serine/threonine protein phosphatase PrpC